MKTIKINPELNIQNFDDIISRIEEYRQTYQELSDEFDGIKISLFDTEKDYKKRRKSLLKESLTELKEKFSYLDNIIIELTSFDANLIIPFVTEYLSRNTFERYLTMNVKRVEYYGRSTQVDYYYFICNVKDVLGYQVSGYNPDGVYDYSIKDELSNTFIHVMQKSSYNLMSADGLTSGFKNFPELLEAARRIINLRLSNPRLGEEECLNLALGGLLSNESTSKDTKPYNRTNINGKKIKEMTLKEIFSSQRR